MLNLCIYSKSIVESDNRIKLCTHDDAIVHSVASLASHRDRPEHWLNGITLWSNT